MEFVYVVVVYLFIIGCMLVPSCFRYSTKEETKVPEITFDESNTKPDIVGIWSFIPNVENVERLIEPPKPDIREQYRVWIENAKRVNESCQRLKGA